MTSFAATADHLALALPVPGCLLTTRRETARVAPTAPAADRQGAHIALGAPDPVAAPTAEDATLFTYWVAG